MFLGNFVQFGTIMIDKSAKIFSFLIFCIGLAFFLQMLPVKAYSLENTGLDATAKKAYGDDLSQIPGGGDEDLSSVAGKLVGAALSFIGIIFFGLIIYGGFIWMIARGNSSEVEKAKDIIIAATIGLVIVLAAYAITRFFADVIFSTSG